MSRLAEWIFKYSTTVLPCVVSYSYIHRQISTRILCTLPIIYNLNPLFSVPLYKQYYANYNEKLYQRTCFLNSCY